MCGKVDRSVQFYEECERFSLQSDRTDVSYLTVVSHIPFTNNDDNLTEL